MRLNYGIIYRDIPQVILRIPISFEVYAFIREIGGLAVRFFASYRYEGERRCAAGLGLAPSCNWAGRSA